MSENTTRRERPGHELGCFYSGTVDDDPHSAVSVSLCHGMVSWTMHFINYSKTVQTCILVDESGD